MATSKAKKKTRRIQVRVTRHVGARLDRLASAYERLQGVGTKIWTHDALRASIYVGVEAEEKRLGLPPLPEEPAPAEPIAAARPGRRKGRKARHG